MSDRKHWSCGLFSLFFERDHVASSGFWYGGEPCPRVVLCCHVSLCLGCRQPAIVIQTPTLHCTGVKLARMLGSRYGRFSWGRIWTSSCDTAADRASPTSYSSSCMIWKPDACKTVGWDFFFGSVSGLRLMRFCWKYVEFSSNSNQFTCKTVHRILERRDEHTEHQRTRGLQNGARFPFTKQLHRIFIYLYVYYPPTRVVQSTESGHENKR
jgi:hypothetical protein